MAHTFTAPLDGITDLRVVECCNQYSYPEVGCRFTMILGATSLGIWCRKVRHVAQRSPQPHEPKGKREMGRGHGQGMVPASRKVESGVWIEFHRLAGSWRGC